MDGKMMELVYLRAKAMKLTNFVKKKAANLGISFEVNLRLLRAIKVNKNQTNTV